MPGRMWLTGTLCAMITFAISACAGPAPARQPAPSSAASSAGTAGPATLALATLLALNPRLNGNGYAKRSGPEAGLTVWAPPGVGHVELVLNQAQVVVAIRGVFPTSTGLQPWYDQAHGAVAAAQTGGVASPAAASSTTPYSMTSGVSPNNTSGTGAVAPNQAGLVGGPGAATSGTRAAAVYTETLWIVPRGQATAGASGLPQYRQVAGLNPALSRARAQTDLLPGAGVYYGQRGYGLMAMVDRGGTLVGVTGWFPVGAGWQPYYDQLPGHEDFAPQWFLKGFTQHVWLVDASDIR